jgi:hypothetical protein
MSKQDMAAVEAHIGKTDTGPKTSAHPRCASGTAEQIRTQRQATLDRADANHPERFARRPRTAWLNHPTGRPQLVL